MSQFSSLVGATIAGAEHARVPECRMMVPELEIASFRSHPMAAAVAEASDAMPSTQPWCYGYVHDAAAMRIHIPMRSGFRSLNVAIATGIALGEALRQTGNWPE